MHVQKVAPLIFTALAALAGCATLPDDHPRPPSTAWDRPLETQLGRGLATEQARQGQASGFHPLGNGIDAFVARVALADVAERTLDLQYYIFHDDLTGGLVLDALLRAADRGVRVRLLLDDTAAKGRDEGLATVATHPRIEVRVFNPSAGRSSVGWLANAATDFDRINHRMHNKMFVADAAMAVVGGRNVGDEYFAAGEGVNFADLDLLAAGPVVRDLSGAFDEFWNSPWAYPIEALHGEAPDAAALERLRTTLAARRDAARDSPYARRVFESDLARRLVERDLPLVWGPAHVVYDRPEKAGSEGAAPAEVKLGTQLADVVAGPTKELLVTSPYFIPGKRGVAWLGGLVAKGVRVRVVTNSLSSNDVSAVHGGYARYREALLRAGVELYELKRLPGLDGRAVSKFGSSRASLHAKSFLVDRERVFVGSLNLDPRSMDLNTELGFVVESGELGAVYAKGFEELVRPVHAYRLELDAGGDLAWITEDGGQTVRHDREPDVGVWKRFSTWFVSIFAPESLL